MYHTGLMTENMKNPFINKEYGLYVHIPFCAKKCFYCAFNVNILKNIPESDYLDKLIQELSFYNKKWKTVYIGGGTPNLVTNDFYLKLFKHLDVTNIEEVTIELNPEFVTKKQIDFYKSLGVNRFSLGIQTFNENGLTVLGRNHNKKQALDACFLLKNENYSFDLIYGYPTQTISELKMDLEFIKKFSPPHLSIYNLSYEKGAFFYKWRKKGKIQALDDEIELKMYNLINESVEKTGLKRYEISNFAKVGYESKHNMLYWTSYPYIGVGTGAHSYYYDKDTVVRSENEKKLRNYLSNSVKEIKTLNILTKKDYVFDKFYSEMRKLYINYDDFLLQTGVNLFNLFKDNNNYESLRKFIEFRENLIYFTDMGVINSDSVFEVFYNIIENMEI